MKPLFLFVTLLLTTFCFAQDERPVVVPQIAIKIGLQSAVQLDAVTIEFLEVIEDSRCPKGTDCIWAGEAKVKVKITDEKNVSRTEVIVIKPITSSNAITSNETGISSLFSAITLNPYPDASIPKDKMEPYVLLVRQN